MLTLSPSMTLAETDTPSCKDVIGKCDKALADKNKALDLSDLALKTCEKDNGQLATKLEEADRVNTRWYHNPIVMFVFGAAAGTLTYTLIKK